MLKLICEVAVALVFAVVFAVAVLFGLDRWRGWRHRRNTRHRLE